MHRYKLMAPGPTAVPESARLAMAQALIHHRSDDYRALMAEVQADLKWLFGTEKEVLLVTSSGTGAFEAALTNFSSPGDKVLCVGGGKFGSRWGEMARCYGMEVVDVELEWGRALRPSRLASELEKHDDVAMVTLTASETSTGVFHPVKELVEVVRDGSDALMAVDGITAVGVHPLDMDAWGIDLLVAGSQKAFAIPPGLGMIGVSRRAWQRGDEGACHPNYYFDLRRERERQRDQQTAFTPAISVSVALREVLRMMRREGREAIYERHRQLSAATRAGLEALDLDVLSERHSHAVSAALVPSEVAAGDVVQRMRTQHGIVIAGGQKHLKGRLIRIGHLGFVEPADIRMTLGAMEEVLRGLGQSVTPGRALAAAQRVFAEG